MRRMLLVETVNPDAFRHHRAELYPFLLSLLRQRGVAAHWVALSIPAETTHVGARFVVGLPDELVAALAAEARARSADGLLFHDRPSPALAAALRERMPAITLVDIAGWLGADLDVAQVLRDIGLSESAGQAGDDGRALIDTPAPSFERHWLGGPRPAGPSQPLRLVSTVSCAYRRPVSGNPCYASLQSPLVAAFRGCAFCARGDAQTTARRVACRTPPVALALAQIRGHQSASSDPGEHLEYLFEDGALTVHLDAFLEAVLAERLRPATFYAFPRVDHVLNLGPRLEELLPRLAGAGHRLRFLSIGAENFSPAENARFNKGVSSEQLWACFERLRDLEARFAGTFGCVDHGYFAAILFTPWTRPIDLRLNIEAARRLGPQWLHRARGTRLQLFPDTPIAELARLDGLTAETPDGSGDIEAVCLQSPDQREIPWRFADPDTALLHRILVRLEPLPATARFAASEPLVAEIRALRQGLPRVLQDDEVALSLALLDAVEALGPAAAPAALFAFVREQAAALTTAAAAAAAPDALQVDLRDDAGTALARFFVAHDVAGRPAFRRVGGLRLWHAGAALAPAAEPLTRILCRLMPAIPLAPGSPQNLALWQRGLDHLLRRLNPQAPASASLAWVRTAAG